LGVYDLEFSLFTPLFILDAGFGALRFLISIDVRVSDVSALQATNNMQFMELLKQIGELPPMRTVCIASKQNYVVMA
jgi:hypothetical protein